MPFTTCCVTGCKSTIRNGFKLFTFPHATIEPEKRSVWIRNVNRLNWNPTACSYVCQKHFRDGRPTEMHPYPDQEMGYPVGRQIKASKAAVKSITVESISVESELKIDAPESSVTPIRESSGKRMLKKFAAETIKIPRAKKTTLFHSNTPVTDELYLEGTIGVTKQMNQPPSDRKLRSGLSNAITKRSATIIRRTSARINGKGKNESTKSDKRKAEDANVKGLVQTAEHERLDKLSFPSLTPVLIKLELDKSLPSCSKTLVNAYCNSPPPSPPPTLSKELPMDYLEVENNALIIKGNGHPLGWNLAKFGSSELKVVGFGHPRCLASLHGFKTDDIITRVVDYLSGEEINVLNVDFEHRCTKLSQLKVYFRRVFYGDTPGWKLNARVQKRQKEVSKNSARRTLNLEDLKSKQLQEIEKQDKVNPQRTDHPLPEKRKLVGRSVSKKSANRRTDKKSADIKQVKRSPRAVKLTERARLYHSNRVIDRYRKLDRFRNRKMLEEQITNKQRDKNVRHRGGHTPSAKTLCKNDQKRPMCTLDGFVYRLFDERNERKQWRCVEKNCTGTLWTTLDNNNPEICDNHNHISNPDKTMNATTRPRQKSDYDLPEDKNPFTTSVSKKATNSRSDRKGANIKHVTRSRREVKLTERARLYQSNQIIDRYRKFIDRYKNLDRLCNTKVVEEQDDGRQHDKIINHHPGGSQSEKKLCTNSKDYRKMCTLDGFVYSLLDENDEQKRWRCIAKNCNGTLSTTLDNNYPEICDDHNHTKTMTASLLHQIFRRYPVHSNPPCIKEKRDKSEHHYYNDVSTSSIGENYRKIFQPVAAETWQHRLNTELSVLTRQTRSEQTVSNVYGTELDVKSEFSESSESFSSSSSSLPNSSCVVHDMRSLQTPGTCEESFDWHSTIKDIKACDDDEGPRSSGYCASSDPKRIPLLVEIKAEEQVHHPNVSINVMSSVSSAMPLLDAQKKLREELKILTFKRIDMERKATIIRRKNLLVNEEVKNINNKEKKCAKAQLKIEMKNTNLIRIVNSETNMCKVAHLQKDLLKDKCTNLIVKRLLMEAKLNQYELKNNLTIAEFGSTVAKKRKYEKWIKNNDLTKISLMRNANETSNGAKHPDALEIVYVGNANELL